MIHPYRGASFFEFFTILIRRVGEWFHGAQLATDEIQLLVLGGMAISAALVGCLLVLRKMTMLAGSLSHTILLGLVLAYLCTARGLPFGGLNVQALLLASVLTALATTFLTTFLHKTMGLKEDASIGLVFTTLFALGVVLVTLYTRNSHLSIEAVTGNADALSLRDAKLVGGLLVFNILVTILFFRPYHLTSFDPQLSRAMGFSATLFNYLLMVQVSLTVVGGFRAVGVLMVLAFLVGPPLAARPFVRSLKGMMLLSSAIGFFCALLGVATSRHLLSVYNLPLSTGGLCVCWTGVLCFSAWGIQAWVKRRRVAQEGVEAESREIFP